MAVPKRNLLEQPTNVTVNDRLSLADNHPYRSLKRP
jgi:hypothetical protein